MLVKRSRLDAHDPGVGGAEDWEWEQETLYVLQNRSLMEQIARTAKTHQEGAGRRVSAQELEEMDAGDRLRG